MYTTIFQTIIAWGFYLLFFIVPLIFTSKNSELFEFNKMVTTYAFTVIIIGAWLCKMIAAKKIIYKRTFLEIPLFLYLASHVLSTIFSIDTRTSIFGYYSRFHEGLLATICYLLLYFAAVSNLNSENVKKIFYWSFAAGIIVAVWGIFEHYGHSLSCLLIEPYNKFDVGCWVQDVKNRVYATLGQPNWMAAYLDILILAGFAFLTKYKKLFAVLFFIALLFTKSRSGVIGLIIGLGIYFVLNIKNFKLFFVTCILFLVTSVVFGLPLPKIDGLSLENYFSKPSTTNSELRTMNSNGYIDIGISTSSDIRKVVWDGAIKVWQRYPVFGSGVETFAYSYYKDRPAAHNMLSEWDFLYNKAHNEVLNLLATTGTVGILTYFLVIASAAKQSYKNPALFGAYITILVTNFFGFSVVIIGLYFFLIPAFSFILSKPNEN
ncbi:MAG: O-antigen ligase family protein [bacterium]|nr:O-antigen ligase family protein [bacterium]